MNKKLQTLFNSLESQRHSVLGLIESLSVEKINNHLEGKWSIAQILSHLIASEQLSVRYLNKKILGIKDAADTGLTEEIKMIALIISQRLPFIKFKAPTVVVENTPPHESMEQLVATWAKTRSDLKETLEKFQDGQLKRKIYKHPFAGMLNIQQALKFFGEHIIHHRPQITKLVMGK